MLRNVKAPATSAATKPGSGRASKTKDKKKEKKDGTERKKKPRKLIPMARMRYQVTVRVPRRPKRTSSNFVMREVEQVTTW